MSFVNDKKGFIFIHVPKTGGTSIASVFGEKASHMSIKDYKINHVDIEQYFKFAFVRNPYDRYASVLAGYQDTSAMRPQHSFVYIKENLAVDFIGRFENIEEDWKKVCKIIGIKKKLPHLNKGKHDELTEEQKKFVAKEYSEDFKLFNYKV